MKHGHVKFVVFNITVVETIITVQFWFKLSIQ